MLKRSKIIYFGFLLLLFTACSENYLYYENIQIPNEKWDVNNPLSFTYTISDTLTTHEIGFTIRYNDNYNNQLLYFFIYTSLPNGKQIVDTVSCYLFQPDGKPFGEGNRIKELNVTYGTLVFPLKGKYTMKVKQAMRTDTLTGINSVGLFINPQKKEKTKTK